MWKSVQSIPTTADSDTPPPSPHDARPAAVDSLHNHPGPNLTALVRSFPFAIRSSSYPPSSAPLEAEPLPSRKFILDNQSIG